MSNTLDAEGSADEGKRWYSAGRYSSLAMALWEEGLGGGWGEIAAQRARSHRLAEVGRLVKISFFL